MSLKKYMVIDLSITIVIGMIVEFLGIFVFNKMLYATIIPFAVSLVVMMISTTRWKSYGIIAVPFLALATVLGGRFINPVVNFRMNYDWKLFISLVIALSTFSLNYLWFSYLKNHNIKRTMGLMVVLAIIDCVLATVTLSLVYYILSGELLIMAFTVWSIFAYALLIIGTCILFLQGVLVDVKDKFLEEKAIMEEEDDFHMDLDDIEEFDVERGVLEDGQGN